MKTKFTEKQVVNVSKFLSLILRHNPQSIGLSLDANGWASVSELLQKSEEAEINFDLELLIHVVESNEKKRFAFGENGSKIRAVQGHSVEVDLAYKPVAPPDILYHGTAQDTVSSILNTGIERRSRQYVHLSQEPGTAINVGQRHGKPVVLQVLAGQMQQAGFEFFQADNGVWLTKEVPVQYIKT